MSHRHAWNVHAHQVLVREIHLVIHPHTKKGPVEGFGSYVQLSRMQGREGLTKGFGSILFGITGTTQAAHQFEDQDLSFLFQEVVALFSEVKLSLQNEQVRLGRCDIQLSHRAILPGYTL